MPPLAKTGRPREHAWREILNAIFYNTRNGYLWRLLPHELPPWKTVYTYFRKWCLDGCRERWNTRLREAVLDVCLQAYDQDTKQSGIKISEACAILEQVHAAQRAHPRVKIARSRLATRQGHTPAVQTGEDICSKRS
jgi:transposase